MGCAAAPVGSLPQADACPTVCRPRNPQATPLSQLLDTHFDILKRLWEACKRKFERRYGFWQAFWDPAVFSHLDCGRFESGFARVVCPECRFEFLVALSCKGRGLCLSCGAKRAAIFSQLLQNKILAAVPHAQWVLTLPKMLRPYFLFHRELLGELARLSYETVREMMAEAADESASRPGMIAVIPTFGSSLKSHPQVHALGSRGGWNAAGQWVPVPYLDHRMAEELFRHHRLRLLKAQDLLSDDRFVLLRCWKSTGFNTDDSVRIPAGQRRTLEHVGRYMLRSPVSLSRMQCTPGSPHIFYAPKSSHHAPSELFPLLEKIDALEFLARIITQIPEPRRQLLFYYGHYANVVRGPCQRHLRFVILAIFTIAAILTPTPDMVTQCLLALPILGLYMASIGISWVVTRRGRG